MKKATFKLSGISPVLFHNVESMRLVKPKSMSHAEFEASPEMFKARLYLENDKPVIPSKVIMGTLKAAAAKSGIKQDGKRATYAPMIRGVIFCLDNAALNKKMSDIKTKEEFVTVNKSKVMRIFPMIDKNWECKVTLDFDDKQISIEAIEEILKYAGHYVGFGDYRPQYGRFNVETTK